MGSAHTYYRHPNSMTENFYILVKCFSFIEVKVLFILNTTCVSASEYNYFTYSIPYVIFL